MVLRFTRVSAAALAVLCGLSASFVGGPSAPRALAHDYTLERLTLEHPWMRPARGGRRVTAAYVRIVNEGDADRLVGASSPLAEAVELHTHIEDDGVMRMRPVEAIAAPADGVATLEPGGDHIMLFGLDESVALGDAVPVTLTFERAGAVTVEFYVEETPSEGHGSAHGAHSGH